MAYAFMLMPHVAIGGKLGLGGTWDVTNVADAVVGVLSRLYLLITLAWLGSTTINSY